MQKFEIVSLNHTEVTIDTSLLKAEQLYFNATEIAKQFGKKPNDYLKTDSTQAYIDARCRSENIRYEDLVRIKQGGKHQGTWLHQKLAIDFARWVDPAFSVALDDWVVEKLEEEKQRKLQRELAKDLHPSLTLAIKNAHKEAKFYHYSNELDMINKIITGYTAKQYKETHSVENVRDNLCAFDVELLNQCQTRNQIMIEDGIEYEERKIKLTNFVQTKKQALLES